jgi:hypothetical protein
MKHSSAHQLHVDLRQFSKPCCARRSAIDGRTTRHPGYAISQRIRKRIEEAFGWAKTVAGLRKMRHRCSCYRRLLEKSAAPPT